MNFVYNMELICKAQNYDWGVRGLESSVAQLLKSSDVEIDENLPYAELWMGTHPSGPSVLKATGNLLSSYINEHPESLGSNISQKFGNNLCFLFKVLSVSQALSIQAHPEKSHAEMLHKERANIYKDPNHKPEMAIALTPFKALCGFRPHEEIQNFFREFPELRSVVGENNASAFILNPSEENLKNCFSFLMRAPKDVISSALKDLEEKLSSLGYQSDPFYLRDLFLTLKTHYPGDVGCFSIYLLNYIVLEPGEAIFLGPNVIHAYLHGDCIECMACSDNVVRAGLTPKYQDVDTLLAMLEYRMIAAESRKFKGSKINQFTTLFNPPVPDFAVQKIEADNGADVTLTKEFSASILIVVKGVGLQLNVFPVRSGNVSSNSVKRGVEGERIATESFKYNYSQKFERRVQILQTILHYRKERRKVRVAIFFFFKNVKKVVRKRNQKDCCVYDGEMRF